MNLIICMTPLQVLIAEKIIEKYPNTPFVGIYLTDIDSEKHQYYAQKLNAITQNFSYLVIPLTSAWQKLKNYQAIRHRLKQMQVYQQQFDTVFLANIDLIAPIFVLACIQYRQLHTFDDGVGNIYPDSRYLQPPKQSKAKYGLKKILGLPYLDTHELKNASQCHYTIFPHEKNLIETLEPIYLFENKQCNVKEKLTVKRLLLGQALDNFIGENAYREIVQTMVKQFYIDAFCPHPRDTLDFSDILPVVRSEKIIEDYILTELQHNPNTQFDIYTFMSTSVFSLRNFVNVSVYLIYTDELMALFKDSYQFLQDRGFALIKLEINP